MPYFVQYRHHGNLVWVRSDLKGKHRDHCLCYSCLGFHPGEPENCEIAEVLHSLNVLTGLTTPVWECPLFDIDT